LITNNNFSVKGVIVFVIVCAALTCMNCTVIALSVLQWCLILVYWICHKDIWYYCVHVFKFVIVTMGCTQNWCIEVLSSMLKSITGTLARGKWQFNLSCMYHSHCHLFLVLFCNTLVWIIYMYTKSNQQTR
jgi:hypothetical protein